MLAIQEVALFTLPFETPFLTEFGLAAWPRLAGWQTAVIFLPLSLLSLGLSYSAQLFILVQPHELRSSITHKSFTYITVSQLHLFPPKPAILQAGEHKFQAVCLGSPLACYSYAYLSRFLLALLATWVKPAFPHVWIPAQLLSLGLSTMVISATCNCLSLAPSLHLTEILS